MKRKVPQGAAQAAIASTLVSGLLVFAGAFPAAATPVAPLMPDNLGLYSVGYSVNKVGIFDTTDGQVSLLPEDVGDAGGAEGGGYDPVTGITWIMQDCELFMMNPDGSTVSRYSVTSSRGSLISDCWGFSPIGDGTAYMSGRMDAPVDDPWTSSTLFKVSLLSGEIIGEPVAINITDYTMETVELAYNSITNDLWASSYDGYIYLLNPDDGSISQIFDGFANNGEWSWAMAVDSNNVLWIYLEDIPTDTEGVRVSALVTLNTENWERYDFPASDFETDALWIHNTTPVGEGESTPELAATGVGHNEWLGATFLALVAGAALAIGARRKLSR